MNAPDEDHPPARSGTPTAWAALILLSLLAGAWIFFDPICCGVIRLGLATVAWGGGDRLSIGKVIISGTGSIQLQDVDYAVGRNASGGYVKSDMVEIHTASVWSFVGSARRGGRRLIQDVTFGKTKVLSDLRGVEKSLGHDMAASIPSTVPWTALLPNAVFGGPTDLVVIGQRGRLAVSGLRLTLPHLWAGRISYREMVVDLGAWHRAFDAGTGTAGWNGETLQLADLALGKDLQLEELNVTARRDRLEFGIRERVGKGLLRGDGAVALGKNSPRLEATLVGERLPLETISGIVGGIDRATGTIGQARLTFRGDPARPLEADSSLRLAANSFHWEGKGWESLRLAATLTGRVLNLSELSLQQKENEIIAQGQSRLPEDWRGLLRAPFTATFHATLNDAGVLASLVGPQLGELAGAMTLQGEIRGADNKAEGYCNLQGSGMKVRNQPVDWMTGCLFFEKETTRLGYFGAWSGSDFLEADGSVANSRPHQYAGTARVRLHNLTKALAQLNIPTAAVFGAGAIEGTWRGEGSTKGHTGTFHATVMDWISPWTRAGMSGSFDGGYAPGLLTLSKAEFRQDDLKLALQQVEASSSSLGAKSVSATRDGRHDPLMSGNFDLPINAPEFWRTGDLAGNLLSGQPLGINLSLHGIKAEELAELLGQKIAVSAMLDGEILVNGTTAKPGMKNSLRLSELRLPGFSEKLTLAMSAVTEDGRLTCLVNQEPAEKSPLRLEVEFPMSPLGGGERTNLPGIAHIPIKGHAVFRNVALDGWAALFGDTSKWPLKGSTLDGSVTLEGTPAMPQLSGNLTLAADSLLLPWGESLGKLSLPIICQGTKTESDSGTAFYRGTPVQLTAATDLTASPWSAKATLAGTNLPVPLPLGLEAHGDAALQITESGVGPAKITGTITVSDVSGIPRLEVTPGFAPPCLPWTSWPATTVVEETNSQMAPLSIRIMTAGSTPRTGDLGFDAKEVTTGEGGLLLQGTAGHPVLTGRVKMGSQTVQLPAGTFLADSVVLSWNDEGTLSIASTAYGITTCGLVGIGIDGPAGDTAPWLAGKPGTEAAEILQALASGSGRKSSPPLAQQAARIRQQLLFPIPAVEWITRRLGKNNPSSLGFDGSPWIFNGKFLPTSPPPPPKP